MELDLAGFKECELAALEHTTRHFEPDHLRSEVAYKLGMALSAEVIRRRSGRAITERLSSCQLHSLYAARGHEND
jgi:hypothetical protein